MITLVLLLLSIFTLFIGAWAFVRWDASWLRNMDVLPVKLLLMVVVAVFLCAALLLLFRLVQRLSEKQLKRTALAGIVILTVGQLLFLLLLHPMLRYDPLKTFDMAVEMLRTHTISGTYETGYFARYTNNYPITILTYWFLLLLSHLGVAQNLFMPAVQLINIACISGAAWLGYLILRELRNRQTAVFYLLVCVLCPLSYVWAGFFYTTTLSMPCLMGILYLFVRLPKAASGARRIRLGILLGLLLILGYKLRATAAIAFIAVALCALLKLWNLRKSGQLSALVRRYAPCGMAFLLTALLSLGFWSAAVNNYVTFDYKNTGFPMIHWVMMSSRWDGSFNQTDEFYTSSFETKEEKAAADKKVLLERIQDAGPVGLVSLAGRKLLNTWVDGTDNWMPENNYSTFGRPFDYLLGNKSGLLLLYAQALRILQMLVIGFAAIASFWQLWRKKERPALFPVQLTLLGGMAFHLLWEASPLYSICFTTLCLMLLADGIAELARWRAAAPALKMSWLPCACSFLGLLLLLFFAKKELVETPIEELNYCVRQYQYAGSHDGYVRNYDQTYVQTFTTDRPFNRISLQVVNPVGEYNQSAFLVRLTREDGTVLYDNDRFLSGMVVNNIPYEFLLDPVIPDGPTRYRLELIPGYIEGDNTLEVLSYNTENYDMYPGGSLTIGGEEQKNGDLAFAVYEYEVTTYFSIKFYLVLAAALLLLAGGITWGSWKCRRSWEMN